MWTSQCIVASHNISIKNKKTEVIFLYKFFVIIVAMDLPIIIFISVIIVELWTWSHSQQQLLPILIKIQNLSLILCTRENCTHISDVAKNSYFNNFTVSAYSSACDSSVKWFFIKDNNKKLKVKNTELSLYYIRELDK